MARWIRNSSTLPPCSVKDQVRSSLAKPCEQIEIRHPGVLPAGPEMVPLYTATELFACHRDHKQLGQRAGKGRSLEVFQPSLFARLL